MQGSRNDGEKMTVKMRTRKTSEQARDRPPRPREIIFGRLSRGGHDPNGGLFERGGGGELAAAKKGRAGWHSRKTGCAKRLNVGKGKKAKDASSPK